MSVALIGISCASCVKDIDTPDRGPQSNPEKEIAGVYEGEWTIDYTVGTKTTTYTIPGTMTLTTDEAGTAYKAILTSDAVVAEQPLLDHQLTTAVNVAPMNTAGRYLVYNSVSPNGFNKDILITKLTDEDVFVEMLVNYGSAITGYVIPNAYKSEGEDRPEDEVTQLTIDFVYNYQCDEGTVKRPKKVDYVQKYNFVGYLKK